MNVPLIVLGVAAAMILIERARPGRVLPRAPGFLLRAVVFNSVQAASVYLIGARLDAWWSSHALANLSSWSTALAVTVSYLVITLVYYAWHRARHEIPWLWRWVHQLHHSPARLEIITSFYKHPIEIGLNAVLSSAVLFGLLGMSPAAGTITVLITGLAELVYHWNVRTPRWLGWFFQRPEMHCVHHERDRHTSNYSDLPLWDMIFGTYDNPATFQGECGFADHAEQRVGTMLRGVDLHDPLQPKRGRWVATTIIVLGVVRIASDMLQTPIVGAVAAATGASPAPKVFTAYDEYEPFSTAMTLHWQTVQGDARSLEVRPDGPRMRGAYNRRNAYGATIVFMPKAREQALLRPMFYAVAQYALCGERPLLDELGVDVRNVQGPIRIEYRTHQGPSVAPHTVHCNTAEVSHA